MKVSEIIKKLNLTVFSGELVADHKIAGGYTSDLLSDVMGNADEGYIWVTLQTHKNIMAIASLKELAAIILVKGLQPDEDTLQKSIEENIPLLGTADEAFEVSGKLYKLLNS